MNKYQFMLDSTLELLSKTPISRDHRISTPHWIYIVNSCSLDIDHRGMLYMTLSIPIPVYADNGDLPKSVFRDSAAPLYSVNSLSSVSSSTYVYSTFIYAYTWKIYRDTIVLTTLEWHRTDILVSVCLMIGLPQTNF